MPLQNAISTSNELVKGHTFHYLYQMHIHVKDTDQCKLLVHAT